MKTRTAVVFVYFFVVTSFKLSIFEISQRPIGGLEMT